jgi:hypothetical protein
MDLHRWAPRQAFGGAVKRRESSISTVSPCHHSATLLNTENLSACVNKMPLPGLGTSSVGQQDRIRVPEKPRHLDTTLTTTTTMNNNNLHLEGDFIERSLVRENAVRNKIYIHIMHVNTLSTHEQGMSFVPHRHDDFDNVQHFYNIQES